MENMNEIVNLISNTGVTIVVLAYFIFRDYKFMNKLDNALSTLTNTVDTLKQVVISKGGE